MFKMQYIVNFEMHKLLDMSVPCCKPTDEVIRLSSCDPTVKQTDQTVMYFIKSTWFIKILSVVNSDAVKVNSK